MRVKDKIIVVTGATKGIGRGIALRLALEGAKVIVSGRDERNGMATVNQIIANQGNALFVYADMSRPEDCHRLIETCVSNFGRVDGLVNNAGIFPHIDLMNTDEQTLDTVLKTNVSGPFFCIQAAIPHMRAQRSGSIVNIGSTHWEMGSKELAAYACSKGALHTLTQHVAAHYAEDKIRCNWITVGWVLSEGEIHRHYKDGHDDAWIAQLAQRFIPFGEYQTAEDIAEACLFLLSDESRQITATDIKVTGGFEPRRNT